MSVKGYEPARIDNDQVRAGHTRRTIVKGAAWSVPAVLVGAPAAHAGISQCTVTGSLQIAQNAIVPVDAVCVGDSQSGAPNVPRIRFGYGRAFLPPYIEICNCTTDVAWYRFREVDTLDSFQIEVDGRHNDQNSSTAGYRPPFKLNPVGAEGGCQRFQLTYRTSRSRPLYTGSGVPSSSYHDVQITIRLQRNPSTSSTAPSQNAPGWTDVSGGVFTVTGRVWRTTSDVNFNSCRAQAPSASASAEVAGDDAARTSGGD